MRSGALRAAGVEGGFTLIEVLMALTVFALIAAIAYGAMATAGQGFQMLSEVRDMHEGSGWTARQLRSDVTYLSSASWNAGQPSEQRQPIRISNDNRGDLEFDDLFLLVHEPGRPGISEVHYYIDEDKGHLMRESRLLWARDSVEPMQWDMGEASSWAVEVMDKDGRWQQEWKTQGGQSTGFVWPRAVRVHMKIAAGDSHPASERQWYLPIRFGVDL
ncbi:MAG: prepilin-type N-terminal cleavage/methylation domain-containing protein [Mariprofundaceae bacterium]